MRSLSNVRDNVTHPQRQRELQRRQLRDCGGLRRHLRRDNNEQHQQQAMASRVATTAEEHPRVRINSRTWAKHSNSFITVNLLIYPLTNCHVILRGIMILRGQLVPISIQIQFSASFDQKSTSRRSSRIADF